MSEELRKFVNTTLIADTHEHLLEESERLAGGDRWALKDIGILFSMYTDSDLAVAGLSNHEVGRLLSATVDPGEKWRLVRRVWPHARTTGHGLATRNAIRLLFGEEDITDANWEGIQSEVEALIKPGFYRHVLKDVANLHHCQVNALDAPVFRETELPGLMLMDISFIALSTDPKPEVLEELFGIEIRTLEDFVAGVDKAFETYAPRAIAVKNQCAYGRSLHFDNVAKGDAERAFTRMMMAKDDFPSYDRRPLEDYLFHVCIDKATEHHLPVKIHTGYLAGHGGMVLHRLRHHGGDMAELCRAHPDARFVFMHCTWPYQDEAIAVAKHFPNAWIDMCWMWTINPIAGVRFLKEFLLAVPSNKVLCFGGDYGPVELVPGHAAIARQGVAQALEELAAEGWLEEDQLVPLAEKLLLTNATGLFQPERLM